LRLVSDVVRAVSRLAGKEEAGQDERRKQMKVGSIPHATQVNAYKETARVAPNPRIGFQEADKLDVNESTRQFQVLLKAAQDAPDVRMEKVDAIKKQIEAGTYHVDSKAVAEKLLGQLER
jgi:negative regulator of flagellin synthesis FlgM